ncbi:hypothetical protein MCHI_002708, partial [Candidatus Magnetoovum chiemensis]
MDVKNKYEGFGFNPSESLNHFVVTITTDKVLITEHFSLDGNADSLDERDPNLKAMLDRSKWYAIADDVKAHFLSYQHQEITHSPLL